MPQDVAAGILLSCIPIFFIRWGYKALKEEGSIIIKIGGILMIIGGLSMAFNIIDDSSINKIHFTLPM